MAALLEMQSQGIVHDCRSAEIRAGNKLGLLRGYGRGVNQNRIPDLHERRRDEPRFLFGFRACCMREMLAKSTPDGL